MKIKLKLFDKKLPVPEYKTAGAAAVDLYARIDVVIEPNQVVRVPLNIALEVPSTHWVQISARSSLHKKGLMLANGIGVGDADYCGDNDEYLAPIFNFSDQAVAVEKGERIVQMMILPRPQIELEVVEQLENKDRGGFGSTGKK